MEPEKPQPNTLNPVPNLPSWRKAAPRNIARLLLLICLVWLLNHALGWIMAQASTLNTIGENPTLPLMIAALLVAYAILIAIPFMPGIEVGLALLFLQGATIAPFVYLATVGGLMTAFVVGQTIPLEWLHNTFRDLRMVRACNLISSIQTATPAARLSTIQHRLPAAISAFTVKYRYVMIAALINLPGTFTIGGGGGILMLAGITRLFRWHLVLLTAMIATLPVPLTVWLMGTDWLR